MSQKPFILLVEDDDRLRGIETRYLRAAGYTVLEARSFREALNKISIKPNLMILDINLPDLTGWEVAGWLERQAAGVPIIVTSGIPPDRRQLEHFEPVAFLEKPFSIERLLHLVSEHTAAS